MQQQRRTVERGVEGELNAEGVPSFRDAIERKDQPRGSVGVPGGVLEGRPSLRHLNVLNHLCTWLMGVYYRPP